MPLIDSFTPPTTSLYQFMALSGLVVYIFFQYLQYRTSQKLLSDARELQMKTKRVKIDQERADQKNTQMIEKLDQLEIWMERARAIPGLQAAEIEAKTKAAAEEVANLVSQNDQHRKELGDLQVKFNIVGDIRKEKQMLSKIVRRVSIGSGLISTIGFILWYFQIQRWQDQILYYKAMHPDSH